VRRAPATAAALAVLLAAGCRHPSKVGPAAPPQEKAAAKEGETPAQKGVPPKGARPRAPASPKALLAEGEIAKIQDALAARGYLERHRPGALDDATTNALREFQKVEGLAETGFPDRLTLQKLGLDPEKSYGKVRDEAKGEGSAGSKRDGK
jgi:peptidoglycan hydrolase-like protein with peptidoglycan-binding domain